MSAESVIEAIAVAPAKNAERSGKERKNGNFDKKKSNHLQNGRKQSRPRGPNVSAALTQAVAVLSDRVGGERVAEKERAREMKEKEEEIEKLSKQLKATDAMVAALSEKSGGMEQVWQMAHVVLVKGEARHRAAFWFLLLFCAPVIVLNVWFGWRWDFSVKVKDNYLAWVVLGAPLLRTMLYGVVLLPSYAVALSIAVFVDCVMFYRGWTRGMLFGSNFSWRYSFVRNFNHEHEDRRTDAGSLQDLKHAAKYREYSLVRRVKCNIYLIRELVYLAERMFAPKPTKVVVSAELVMQAATAKNLDPYLPPSEARAAIQRSVAHNSTVNIDRSLMLTDHFVQLETVSLVYAMYLQYRQKIADRDFLLTLPK